LARERIGDVAFRSQAPRMLDPAIEQVGSEIVPVVIADEEWPLMQQRVRHEPGAIAGLLQLFRPAVPNAGPYEIQANAFDPIVVIAAGKPAVIEELPVFDPTLRNTERRLPIAMHGPIGAVVR